MRGQRADADAQLNAARSALAEQLQRVLYGAYRKQLAMLQKQMLITVHQCCKRMRNGWVSFILCLYHNSLRCI